MKKIFLTLNGVIRRLFEYKFIPSRIEDIIDRRIKEKSKEAIYLASKTARVHATVRLIEQAKESLIININHRDFEEVNVMNDSYVYSALYDAGERGVNIDIVLTGEANSVLFKQFLGLAESFIADTDDFTSSMIVDGMPKKNVYSGDGKTVFIFYW